MERTYENRWSVISAEFKKTDQKLLDLGCWEGDLCSLALANGMEVHGIDQNADAISVAEQKCPGGTFEVTDLTLKTRSFFSRFDVVLLLSVYPYLGDKGEKVVKDIVLSGATLFFETQMSGDGAGPEEFKEEADVRTFLRQFGIVKRVAEFPVEGRSSTRTIWKVSKPRAA